MGLTLVTAATAEPITTIEAKAHIRLEISDDDTLVGNFIQSARETCEFLTDRQFVTATWKLSLDNFPCRRCIRLPLPPLQSVSNVFYTDSGGIQQEFASSNYVVDAASEPGRICLAPGSSWPTTQNNRANAVEITFVAGFGAPADVPQSIKAAMLLLVGHLYENREATTALSLKEVPLAVAILLGKHHWGGRYG